MPTGPSKQGDIKRVPMTSIRKRIAERLVQAQHTAAILTTFNEIDMTKVIELRAKYKDKFKEKYGVNLGFNGFFVKAAIEALKAFPAVNAWIDGTEMEYHNYYNIGIAVSTDRGLMVPNIKDADNLTVAGVELAIRDLALKGRDGKITPDDLMGGTFSITNGGVFGSLLSTPILNAPQSAILGLHKIEERAVVINGKIEVRSMMYVALSYDHRIIDGKEAVSFLVKIKEGVEDPERLLLEI
jgi:2-oxoglutarate dehydrogenase E2 component (dihydrolipoamide succinyltransferase)